jgi:hypothetical protein
MMRGVVDPETLYTKQNCIGMCRIVLDLVPYLQTKAVAVLERSTKGE